MLEVIPEMRFKAWIPEVYIRTNTSQEHRFLIFNLSSCKRSNNAVKIPQAVVFVACQHKLDKAKRLFGSSPSVLCVGTGFGLLIVKKGLKSPDERK